MSNIVHYHIETRSRVYDRSKKLYDIDGSARERWYNENAVFMYLTACGKIIESHTSDTDSTVEYTINGAHTEDRHEKFYLSKINCNRCKTYLEWHNEERTKRDESIYGVFDRGGK